MIQQSLHTGCRCRSGISLPRLCFVAVGVVAGALDDHAWEAVPDTSALHLEGYHACLLCDSVTVLARLHDCVAGCSQAEVDSMLYIAARLEASTSYQLAGIAGTFLTQPIATDGFTVVADTVPTHHIYSDMVI